MKRLLSIIIIFAFILCASVFVACDLGFSGDASEYNNNTGGEKSIFSSSDTAVVGYDSPNATITLSGSSGTISDTARGSSGTTVTINTKGIYLVKGSSENVTIVIDDIKKSGVVYLVLKDVDMVSSSPACIFARSSDKVVVYAVGSNTLTSTATTESVDSSSGTKISGVLCSKDDVTINGEANASLKIKSGLSGIVCKDDLKVTGSALTVEAGKKGFDANDSVRIGGGTISIESANDGIQVENSNQTGYFHMQDGSLSIKAGYDGIDCQNSQGYISFVGGTANVFAPARGSNASKSSSYSQKGLKSAGRINVSGGTINVSSADDGIHGIGNVSISGGNVSVSSSDDGVHSDAGLKVSGGEISVTKAKEGFEATAVEISGGTISINSSDDGINAASTLRQSANLDLLGMIKISGGNVYIQAEGDGVDSNGNLYVSGGTLIIDGPTNNNNGALDKGDAAGCVAEITGGTVLALGTTSLAINFDSGTQCSALVNINGNAGAAITVNDGSNFSHTTTKPFACAVYSSPFMKKGSTYTLTAGSRSVTMNFSNSLYYRGR